MRCPASHDTALVYTKAVYTAGMKNVTLSADESLIEAARQRARAEHTTLNEAFRQWLADYAQAQQRVQRSEEVLTQLRGRLQVGRRLGRDEMNAR